MTTNIENHQDLELQDFFLSNGRINRAKYIDIWGWITTFQITFILVSVLLNNLGIQNDNATLIGLSKISFSLFGLTILVGTISLILNGIRRVQDCDKSGWYSIIPFYSAYLIIFKKGTSGDNRFGNDPLKKELPKKEINETKWNRQQKILKIFSLTMILGGVLALTLIILTDF